MNCGQKIYFILCHLSPIYWDVFCCISSDLLWRIFLVHLRGTCLCVCVCVCVCVHKVSIWFTLSFKVSVYFLLDDLFVGVSELIESITTFFKNLFIFTWRIISLQYCIALSHTSTWISHRYVHIYMSFSSWTSLPPPTWSHPPRSSWNPQFKYPESYNKFTLAIYFSYGSMYAFMLLCLLIAASPFSYPITIPLFSMSVSPLLP